jgi:hypothetical protein
MRECDKLKQSLEEQLEAINEGGTVFEGKEEHESMDEALADLEAGIKAFMGGNTVYEQ